MQAQVAAEAGYLQLAANFKRAAELVKIPNIRLLEIYNALRPCHSTYAELQKISIELEKDYGASENARFVQEAADAYKAAGLLRAYDKLPRFVP
jgi:propanediol dehydratase small subunit